MTTKNYFLRRAPQIHLGLELRNQIITDNLYHDLDDNFQVSDCEDVVRKANTPQTPQFVVLQQTTDQQFAYQTQTPNPHRRKKTKKNNGLVTAAIVSLIIIAVLLIIAAITTQKPFANLPFGNNNLPEGAPQNCGGDMPNTYLVFGMWTSESNGSQYFVPKNSPALTNEASAICFNVDEMNRFYSQTNIVTASGDVTGQEAFVRSIINTSTKKELAKDDPRLQDIYTALVEAVKPDKFMSFPQPEFATYKYLYLPGLSSFITSPEPTANQYPTNTSSVPIIPTPTQVPITPTPFMVVIQDTPTSLPAPTMQAVATRIEATLPVLMATYGVPTITPGAPTFPPVSFVSVDWLISSGKARYGACSPIPDAGGFYDYSSRWPMDGAVQIYLAGGCGDGEGEHFQVDFSPYANRHVVDSNYRSIHISQNPYPNWGPAYQIPGTSYYIQPFNP